MPIGFIVIINGRQLAMHEFNGIIQNKITIHPPKKTPGVDGFDLIIQKINMFKTIYANPNSSDLTNIVKDILWNRRIMYAEHS